MNGQKDGGADCYLFDIDGTIADLSHRLHHITKEPKDWPAFFAACRSDAPIPHVCSLARTLVDADQTVIFVSGRSDECRADTEYWLAWQGLSGLPLYMRTAGDHRQDNIVKGELLDQIIADGYTPTMAFDDRNQVVEMWRSRGVPCAQVAPGDF